MEGLITELQCPPEAAAAHSPTHLPRAVQAFWLLALGVFGLAVLVTCVERGLGMARTRWDPLSDPLLGDLLEYPATYRLLHTAAFFDNGGPGSLPGPMFSAVAYPPFAAAVLAPLYLLFSPVWGFLSLAVAWLAFAFWSARRALLRNGTTQSTATLFPLSLMLISFPIARLVHQGNIEVVVWIFTASGMWAFLRRNDRSAAVLWGLAAAMKLYPVVLLILFLPRRRYRLLLLGAAVCAAVTWLSLWWLGPTVAVAWAGSVRNVFGYQHLRASEWSLRELIANHSVFGWVKLGAQMVHAPSERLLLPYFGCGAALLIWAFWGRLGRMPIANQLLGSTVFMIAIPPVSYYHTLVHMYVPLLLLVCLALQAHCSGIRIRGLKASLLLCIPLFVPYPMLLSPRMFLFPGLLQSLALLLLFLCALQFPFSGPTPADASPMFPSTDVPAAVDHALAIDEERFTSA